MDSILTRHRINVFTFGTPPTKAKGARRGEVHAWCDCHKLINVFASNWDAPRNVVGSTPIG